MTKNNPWLVHVKKVKVQHPKLKLSEILKLAKKSYSYKGERR